jgi:hypothetical protein
MAGEGGAGAVKALEALVGEWTIEVSFPGPPSAGGATLRFEWLSGERFLIQRWQVPIPEARTGSRSLASIRSGGAGCSTTSTPAASLGSTR